MVNDSLINQMVQDAVKHAMEAKKKAEIEAKTETQLNELLKRTVDKKGFSSEEVQELALIYKTLAPNDTTSPISIKMMNEFCMELEEKYPSEYQKMRWYFRMEEDGMTERKREKIALSVEKFLDKFRTVENCYKYSKGFKEMSDRVACKLDASTDITTLERVKWLRMWLFLIKDQSLFWYDTEDVFVKDGKDGEKKKKIVLIDHRERERLDRETYITPDKMMSVLENENFSAWPDGCIILEMLKAFLSLFPQEIQDDVIRFAELDRNEHSFLNAGEIRNRLKKKLFPIFWVSGTSFFFTKPGIGVSREEFIPLIITASKKGFENLPTFIPAGFEDEDKDGAKDKSKSKILCYDLGDIEDKGEIKSFAVSCKDEFDMYIEVYKWLTMHPDFKFGADENKKTLKAYGIQGFDDEQCVEKSDWFKEIAKKMQMQEGKSELKSALKRVQKSGRDSASKRDIKYLNYFEYMMKKNPKALPRNVVNLYGKVFFNK